MLLISEKSCWNEEKHIKNQGKKSLKSPLKFDDMAMRIPRQPMSGTSWWPLCICSSLRKGVHLPRWASLSFSEAAWQPFPCCLCPVGGPARGRETDELGWEPGREWGKEGVNPLPPSAVASPLCSLGPSRADGTVFSCTHKRMLAPEVEYRTWSSEHLAHFGPELIF